MNKKDKAVRRPNRQTIIVVILMLVGMGVIVLLQTKNSSIDISDFSRVSAGNPAPDFTLSSIDGQTVSLADYRGKVVLLNIWATWCPPCVEEMPSMEKLHQTIDRESFKILAVSIDTSGEKTVNPFMKKHKLTFTTLIDTEGTIKKQYQTTGVPESFIIDKNGMIVEKVVGPADWAAPQVVDYFQKLIRMDGST